MRAAKRRFKRERDRRTIINHPHNQRSEERKRRFFKFPASALVLSQNATATTVTNTTTTTVSNGNSFRRTQLESSPDTTSEDEKTPMNVDSLSERYLNARETRLVAYYSRNDLQVNGKNQRQKPSTCTRTMRKVRSKENLEMKHERKAWRTLAIITGTFVACWTPFFLVSLYRPLCRCRIPILLENVTSWLG